MPIETLIYAKQEGYYDALNASNSAGESAVFITFMLGVIRAALKDVVESRNKLYNVGTNEEKVLALLGQDSENNPTWRK